MKGSIWDKQVVVVAEMEQQDVTDWVSPLPLVFSAKWHHYLGFYLPLLCDYFSPFLPYPYQPSDIRISLQPQDLPLSGCQILSQLYVLYCQEQQQPIRIRCHARSEHRVVGLDLEKHFKQNLKASTCIRYGRFGASIITVDMSVNNIHDMFSSFRDCQLQYFMGKNEEDSAHLGYRFIVQNRDKIQNVPVRIVTKEWTIERSLPKKNTLQQFWQDLAPGVQPNLKLHGVQLQNLSIQIEKLEDYCHPDGFLYFTL